MVFTQKGGEMNDREFDLVMQSLNKMKNTLESQAYDTNLVVKVSEELQKVLDLQRVLLEHVFLLENRIVKLEAK